MKNMILERFCEACEALYAEWEELRERYGDKDARTSRALSRYKGASIAFERATGMSHKRCREVLGVED